jgi:hypothetical protein
VLIDCCMPTCTCTHAKLSKTLFFLGQILNPKSLFFWGRREYLILKQGPLLPFFRPSWQVGPTCQVVSSYLPTARSRKQGAATAHQGPRGARSSSPQPHSRGPLPRERSARHNSTARTNPTGGAQLKVVEPTPCRGHRGSSHRPPHHSTPLRPSKIRPFPGPKLAQDELAVVARREAAPHPQDPTASSAPASLNSTPPCATAGPSWTWSRQSSSSRAGPSQRPLVRNAMLVGRI